MEENLLKEFQEIFKIKEEPLDMDFIRLYLHKIFLLPD